MVIIELKDINDKRLDIYYRDKENQLHNSNQYGQGLFIVEGELIINRAINANYEAVSFLVKEDEIDKYQSIYDNCPKAIIYKVSNDIFSKLKGFILLRGIIGCFKRKDDYTVSDIIKDAKRIVVLDGVTNPTNIGAIFRNAVGLFADGVLVTRDSADPLYRRSIRTSMGNVFKIKWTYINRSEYMDILHNYGYKIVSMALRNNSISIEDKKMNEENKLAIVLGSEGYGLDANIIDKSDYVVKIDINDEVDSLNVASASGIALWQLCKGNKRK